MPTPVQGRARPWGTLAIAVAAVAVMMSEPWIGRLEYHRAPIATGELWRLISGHLTHWSWNHLVWDLLVVMLFGWRLERRLGTTRLVLGLLAASLIISFAGWLWLPEMMRYRGLSGLACALVGTYAAGAVHDAWTARRLHLCLAWIALLVGLGVKTAFELNTGTTAFVDSQGVGFAPAPLAHAIGGLVGLTWGWSDRYPRP